MTTAIHNDSKLTQARYDLLAKAVTFGETGDVEGWEDQYFDESTQAISTTREDLESFDGRTWAEARGREDFEIDGHKCMHWESAQAMKGQQRVSVTIVDLGGIRLIYQV